MGVRCVKKLHDIYISDGFVPFFSCLGERASSAILVAHLPRKSRSSTDDSVKNRKESVIEPCIVKIFVGK